MTTSRAASDRRHRFGATRSGVVAILLVAVIGCASQTEQDLKSALREYVGDSPSTSERVRSAPPTPPTTAPRETTTSSPTSTTTSTTAVSRIGDGRTISRETADQVDRCLAGWQTLRVGAESSGRLDRDEFERTSTACDEAVHMLSLDRSDEVITTGPTEQLNALLLQLRLQWMTPTMEFARRCPAGSDTSCALGAEDLGGSFDFLVITGPSALVPAAFLDEVDEPLDASRIPGLKVG